MVKVLGPGIDAVAPKVVSGVVVSAPAFCRREREFITP